MKRFLAALLLCLSFSLAARAQIGGLQRVDIQGVGIKQLLTNQPMAFTGSGVPFIEYRMTISPNVGGVQIVLLNRTNGNLSYSIFFNSISLGEQNQVAPVTPSLSLLPCMQKPGSLGAVPVAISYSAQTLLAGAADWYGCPNPPSGKLDFQIQPTTSVNCDLFVIAYGLSQPWGNQPTAIGGSDGTNIRTLKVDSAGFLQGTVAGLSVLTGQATGDATINNGTAAAPLWVAEAVASANINTVTTTIIKATSGNLKYIAINTAAAGTISIYDIASAGCTGTPGSGRKATITTATPADEAKILRFDMVMASGICVVTSTAVGDLTVGFQ